MQYKYVHSKKTKLPEVSSDILETTFLILTTLPMQKHVKLELPLLVEHLKAAQERVNSVIKYPIEWGMKITYDERVQQRESFYMSLVAGSKDKNETIDRLHAMFFTIFTVLIGDDYNGADRHLLKLFLQAVEP